MKELDFLKNVDIYLLDQCMKGNLNENSRVLDAGFGKGRNFRFLKKQEIDVMGIDPNESYVKLLQTEFTNDKKSIIHSSIEAFSIDEEFDFIVCNAVLHFAKNRKHFNEMVEKLVSFLAPGGILFIRMTSDIGIESKLIDGNEGVFVIPDGSTRYILTRQKVDKLVERYSLKLKEPVKTVNVDGMRCMTTLVLQK